MRWDLTTTRGSKEIVDVDETHITRLPDGHIYSFATRAIEGGELHHHIYHLTSTHRQNDGRPLETLKTELLNFRPGRDAIGGVLGGATGALEGANKFTPGGKAAGLAKVFRSMKTGAVLGIVTAQVSSALFRTFVPIIIKEMKDPKYSFVYTNVTNNNGSTYVGPLK